MDGENKHGTTTRKKTLGLIGGTSWHATEVYYRLINEMAAARNSTATNPPMIIYSIDIAVMREQHVERINATYLDVSNKLEAAGAEAIVICANTPHMVVDHVQPKIGIPILHIADAIGREAELLGLKKLGLMANRPTTTLGFIPDYLQKNYGISTVIPGEKDIDKSHHYISKELTRGNFTEEARNYYLSLAKKLMLRGAEGIILGCTELPILIQADDLNTPLLATTHLHARMAVDFIFN